MPIEVIRRYADEKWSPYTKEGDRYYIAKSQWADKDTVKGAGFVWHKEQKVWWTTEIGKACKLAEFADCLCKQELEDERAKRMKSVELSRSASTDVDFPRPDGLNYLGYQKVGIQYMIDRSGTLLADDMGLGKTIQCIGLLNADPTLKRVLVIVPASIRINWRRELEKWLVRDVKVAIGDNSMLPMPEDGYDIVIIGYDTARKMHAKLKKQHWDLLVVDEAHRVKNPDTQISRAIYGGRKKITKENGLPGYEDVPPIVARKIVFTTGTPIVNRPKELYYLLCAIDHSWRKKYYWYMRTFCNAHSTAFGMDADGANKEKLPELQQILRETIMIRRLKVDVLKELPPKRRQVIEFSDDEIAIVIGKEAQAVASRAEKRIELQERLMRAKIDGSDEAYNTAIKELQDFESIAFGDMAAVRKETAIAKIPYVINHLTEMMEAVDKIVLMAHHHEVQDQIFKHFGKVAVMHRGGMNDTEKQKSVDRFQQDASARIFVGSILASGVGTTLTAASYVCFAELDWVPGNVSQAEDRCHRIGQTDTVFVQHLVLAGSIDAKMARTIIEKQEIIELALDKEAVVEPIAVGIVPPVQTTRKEIAAIAEALTTEQVEAIHVGIRMLALYCDGAHRMDGMGFSKIDANIGHSFAQQSSLSPRQAAYGKKLCLKYKRQLPKEIIEAVK
jgi:SWI/SNF-related matrix-associated actin-dependent regulator of chromatin subfamily A-like protein 1